MLRRVRHRLEYLILLGIALLVRSLPRRWALAVGAGIGALGWRLGVRRRLVLRNLAAAFPHLANEERRRLGHRAARNFGRTVSEFLRFAGPDRRRTSERVRVEGIEALRSALAGGEGALVITGHLGAWALYVAALASAGIPSALLVGKQRNELVDRMILGIPGDAVRFVSKGKSAPRHVIGSLREGRAVVMVADHYASSETVWAPFLGHPASTLPLPGALVAKHRLPLFLMTGVRDQAGRHRLRIEPLPIDPRLAGDELRLDVACRSNTALGAAIAENPDQYFWYHDRWKTRGKSAEDRHVLGAPPGPRRPPAVG